MDLSHLPDARALAQQVTTALQPYVPLFTVEAVKATGKRVPAAIEKVWVFVKDRFAKKPAAEESLKDLLKNPDDSDLQAAVRVQLRKLLEEDAEFAAALRPLAETATAADQTTTYQADVKGDGNIIAQGTGITISTGPGGDSKKK